MHHHPKLTKDVSTYERARRKGTTSMLKGRWWIACCVGEPPLWSKPSGVHGTVALGSLHSRRKWPQYGWEGERMNSATTLFRILLHLHSIKIIKKSSRIRINSHFIQINLIGRKSHKKGTIFFMNHSPHTTCSLFSLIWESVQNWEKISSQPISLSALLTCWVGGPRAFCCPRRELRTAWLAPPFTRCVSPPCNDPLLSRPQIFPRTCREFPIGDGMNGDVRWFTVELNGDC